VSGPTVPWMVVPTLTRHDLLGRMLASVDVRIGTLVVVDNSGTLDDAGTDLADDFRVLRMPTNLGVAASWNLALRLAYRAPWVLIASDDVTFPAGALEAFAELSGEDRLVLSSAWPHWCAFTIGAGIVHRVGVFEEGYFPAYFEDTDYERRLHRAGLEVTIGPHVGHQNSSTLRSGDFAAANDRSFAANQALFEADRPHGFDPYRWRALAWF